MINVLASIVCFALMIVHCIQGNAIQAACLGVLAGINATICVWRFREEF